MKIELNPMIEKLSGKLDGLVLVSIDKELVDGKNIKKTHTYLRKKRFRASHSIPQDNLNKAFKIMSVKFKELKANLLAYETWRIQAKAYEDELSRNVTAYLLFTTYYMTMYTHTLGSDVRPTNLSNGTFLLWSERSMRKWAE